MLEEEMSKPFEIAARQKGYTDIIAEVPIMHRTADYVMRNSWGEIISVELKVKKWRHAIEQAKVHSLASDLAYICLPVGKHQKSFIKALEDADIGLFSLDVKNCTMREERRPTKRNVEKFREELERKMKLFSKENHED